MVVWEHIYSEAREGGEDPMAVYKACFEEHLAGVDELKRQVWGVGLGGGCGRGGEGGELKRQLEGVCLNHLMAN